MNLSHYIDVFFNKYYPLTILNRIILRTRNKKEKITILCANCIGGIIYHNLGLRFYSPTVNLTIINSSFIKFLHNQSYYLGLSPIEVNGTIDSRFPNARIGDLDLIFNHSENFQDGCSKWNNRKKRIIEDEKYVIVFDYLLSDKDIADLGKVDCKKLVCFTAKKYPYSYCVHLPNCTEFSDGHLHVSNMLLKNIWGKRKIEMVFDYVGWLNSEDDVAEHFRR